MQKYHPNSLVAQDLLWTDNRQDLTTVPDTSTTAVHRRYHMQWNGCVKGQRSYTHTHVCMHTLRWRTRRDKQLRAGKSRWHTESDDVLECYTAYTQGDRRHNRKERLSRQSPRRQSPVGCSIKQVFVAATIACSVYTGWLSWRSSQTVASCIRYRRSLWRWLLRQSWRQSPRVYALLQAISRSYHVDRHNLWHHDGDTDLTFFKLATTSQNRCLVLFSQHHSSMQFANNLPTSASEYHDHQVAFLFIHI